MQSGVTGQAPIDCAAEDYLTRTTKTEDKNTITETNRIPQTKNTKMRSAYVRNKIYI